MAVDQGAPFLLELHLLRDRVPSFASYPFCLPAVCQLQTLAFHPRVTFFVGENGSGKSTLLEAIALACDLNPEGGSRNFNFATRASHSELDRFLRLARSPRLPRDSFFLRAESFYNVATEIERLGPEVLVAYGGLSLHEQSHGEAFFTLFEHRFRTPGLYLLDEPESALSPTRQMTFLTLLHQHCEAGSQFVIATHSPIIMAYPHAWIYVLGTERPTCTAYTDTEHYRVTRAFLTKTEKMLAVLLESEGESAAGDEQGPAS